MLTKRAIQSTRHAAPAKCVLASVLDSARRLDRVTIVTKPFPCVGVRVFQRWRHLSLPKTSKALKSLEIYLGRP